MKLPKFGPHAHVWFRCERCEQPLLHKPERRTICEGCRLRDEPEA